VLQDVLITRADQLGDASKGSRITRGGEHRQESSATSAPFGPFSDIPLLSPAPSFIYLFFNLQLRHKFFLDTSCEKRCHMRKAARLALSGYGFALRLPRHLAISPTFLFWPLRPPLFYLFFNLQLRSKFFVDTACEKRCHTRKAARLALSGFRFTYCKGSSRDV